MSKEAEIKIALASAKAITWDGCHKIYVAMDAGQVREFRYYEYDMVPVKDIDEAYATLCEWWDESCGLRFISAVRTVKGNPNDGFMDLIPQCFVEDDDDLYVPGTELFARAS